MSRAVLAGFLIFLSCLLLGLVTLAMFEIGRSGTVAPATLTLIVATLACLLVLFGVSLARNQPAFTRAYCSNCGARVYETRRSLDRRRVITCFQCGMEWAPPMTAAERGLFGSETPTTTHHE